MSVSLTTPEGQIVENPTTADLSRALDVLLSGADPDADLWLEHDSGWTLSAVPTGDLFLESESDGDRYWTIGPLERPALLLLLEQLAHGHIEALRAEPWEEAE